MRSTSSTCVFLFLQVVAYTYVATATDYDFFYFIQQWPGSVCATKEGCCLPKTGKPASDFVVYGFQPGNLLGMSVNCPSNTSFDSSKLSNVTRSLLYRDWPLLACPRRDSTKLWRTQWKKYGTCSEAALNQDQYFKTAIKLKKVLNLLKMLTDAGIKPNGSSYAYGDIYETMLAAVHHMPGIRCSKDKYGNYQLNLIYLCGNELGEIAECPGMLPSDCPSLMKFPSF